MDKKVFRYEPVSITGDDVQYTTDEAEQEEISERKVLIELVVSAADYLTALLGGKYAGFIRRAIINMSPPESTSDISRSLVRTKCMLVYNSHRDELPSDPLRRAHVLGSIAGPKIGILPIEVRPELITIANELDFYPHPKELGDVETTLFAGQQPKAGPLATPVSFESSREDLHSTLTDMSDEGILEVVSRLGIHRHAVDKPVAQVIRETDLMCGDPDCIPILNADARDIIGNHHPPENIRIKPVVKAPQRAVSPRTLVRKNAGEYLVDLTGRTTKKTMRRTPSSR